MSMWTEILRYTNEDPPNLRTFTEEDEAATRCYLDFTEEDRKAGRRPIVFDHYLDKLGDLFLRKAKDLGQVFQ